MKYLLGPVSINAEMAWCPEPKKINFQKSLIDLSIKMQVGQGFARLATKVQIPNRICIDQVAHGSVTAGRVENLDTKKYRYRQLKFVKM
jgi:hypothetical protein